MSVVRNSRMVIKGVFKSVILSSFIAEQVYITRGAYDDDDDAAFEILSFIS